MELIKNVYSFEEAYTIENYPYGFRLKTTMYKWIEKNNKGMRLCEQTINPKNGKLNAIKKSVYSEYIRFYKTENDYIFIYTYNTYSNENLQKALEVGIFETKEEENFFIDKMNEVDKFWENKTITFN